MNLNVQVLSIGSFKLHIFKVVGDGNNEAWEDQHQATNLSKEKLGSDAQNSDSASVCKLKVPLEDLQHTPEMKCILP